MAKDFYYKADCFWEFFDNAPPHVREDRRWAEELNCAHHDIKQLEKITLEPHPHRDRRYRPLEKKDGPPRA